MAPTHTKEELVTLLTNLSDDFFQAAGKTENDPQQRSYRAGMADGFNIARQLVGNLEERAPAPPKPEEEGVPCWKLTDPNIGVSLWRKEADARQVAKFRMVGCTVEPYRAGVGDVISELGVPDYEVRPADLTPKGRRAF